MTGKLLIKNGTLVSWVDGQEVQPDRGIYIEDGFITEIGVSASLIEKYPDIDQIDAHGQLIMPGNICAHTHFYGAFSRGMAIPGPAPEVFPQILERLWWPLDQALDEESVRLSALVCLMDAIKHGTTTLFDHHASPSFLIGSLDVIADAVQRAGLRAVLCYEATDRYGTDSAKLSVDENERFLKQSKAYPLIEGMVGIHASVTVGPETLEACIDVANRYDSGIHIHVAEHHCDETDSLLKYGKRIVDRLFDARGLNYKSILVHGVHLDLREYELIRESGAWLTHQPRSNMNNAVGVADVEGALRLGIPVALGNDGFSNNMYAEWKEAYLLHKIWHRDPRRANGMDIVQMAIHNNARLAAVYFPQAKPGYLEVGRTADIILVDYHPITPLSSGNIPWHILFGFEASAITGTIVNGVPLMLERQLLNMDEEEITAHSREAAIRTWNRYQAILSS